MTLDVLSNCSENFTASDGRNLNALDELNEIYPELLLYLGNKKRAEDRIFTPADYQF